jgi:hypothetical protein
VFEIGSRADDPLGATQLFVAASVWGVGTSARTVSRRARSFEQDVGGHLGLRLSKAIAVSRAMGPEAAYARLLRGGDLHVDRLGPSFFTKILYFATDDLRSIHRRPLILDQYVAASLNRAEIADWTLSEWSPGQYGRWLELAHGWAAYLGDTVTGDVVEYVLFRAGKQAP